LSLLKNSFTVVCVFVLPVCRILNLNSEVKTCVENVIEKFIVIRCVYTCIVHLVFHIQGVTGGTDQTSEWCSLCSSIPI